ncbi:hypothetical protein [Candidatus Harpocratesius sp.]
MLSVEKIFHEFQQKFENFRNFFWKPNKFSISFLQNLSYYLIEDLFLNNEPKERCTGDPAYAFYRPISIFSSLWNNLRKCALNNELNTVYIIISLLEALSKGENDPIGEIWKKYGDIEGKSKLLHKSGLAAYINPFHSDFFYISNSKISATLDSKAITFQKLIETYCSFFIDAFELPNKLLFTYKLVLSSLSLGFNLKNLDQHLRKDLVYLLETVNKENPKSVISESFFNLEDFKESITNSEINQEQSIEFIEKLQKFKEYLNKNLEFIQIFIQYSIEKKKLPTEPQLGQLILQKITDIIKIEFHKGMKNDILISKVKQIKKSFNEILKFIYKIITSFYSMSLIEDKIMLRIEEGLQAIQSFNKLFSGMGWDLSEGILQNIALEKVLKYTEIIENHPEINKLAEEIGRLEGILGTRDIWELRPNVSQEIFSVHHSDEISRAFASELVKLKHSQLRLLFLSRWLDHKLMTYSVRGKYWNKEKYSEKERRGPIIVCIDTSGSMKGTPERLAKATTLAIVKITKKEFRDVHLILFSGPSQYKEIQLLNSKFNRKRGKYSASKKRVDFSKWREFKKEYYTKVLEFLSISFSGGTDFRTPLQKANEKLNTSEFKRADILFISDGIAFVDEIVNKITSDIQEKNARIFSLIIGDQTSVVREFADQIYCFNPKTIVSLAKPRLKIAKMLKKITLNGGI